MQSVESREIATLKEFKKIQKTDVSKGMFVYNERLLNNEDPYKLVVMCSEQLRDYWLEVYKRNHCHP